MTIKVMTQSEKSTSGVMEKRRTLLGVFPWSPFRFYTVSLLDLRETLVTVVYTGAPETRSDDEIPPVRLRDTPPRPATVLGPFVFRWTRPLRKVTDLLRLSDT